MTPLRARLALLGRIWFVATMGERRAVMLGGAAALFVVALIGAWIGQTDNLDLAKAGCRVGGTALAALAGLWWTTFCGGAARQNTPANARLVPGLNRAVRACAVLAWIMTMLALAPLAWSHPDGAMLFPQFALSLTGFGLYRAGRHDGFAVLAAIVLLYLFGSASQPLMLFLIHPAGVALVSLLALAYAAWALPRAFPVAGERHWNMRAKQERARAQNDLVEWDKAKRGRARRMPLYAWLLARDSRKGGNRIDLLLHGLGPGNHRFHVLVPVACCALLLLLARAVLALLDVPAADQIRVGGAQAALSGMVLMATTWARYSFSLRSTAGEQALLRLAPVLPRSHALNHVLGRHMLATSAGEWIVATGLALALLALWGGNAAHMRVAIIVAVSTLASFGISLDDYAHKRDTNAWQHALLTLWLLFVLALGFVYSDDNVIWGFLCGLQLATALAFIAARWRRMQDSPVAFPAGRMA